MIRWLKINYTKIVKSIAFYPALIAILFLLLSYLFLQLDISAIGKNLRADYTWLRMDDPDTARTIISAIVGGIISLTVFSFTMVMIILNQTASQMSNRILDELIGNRFQQLVLGTYIGTIVFSLFLISTVNSEKDVPSISIYFLIIISILDIFLFIYFLHFITQSVKYDVIIDRIYNETTASLQKCSTRGELWAEETVIQDGYTLTARRFGIFQDVDTAALWELSKEYNCSFQILVPKGQYVSKGTPVILTSAALPPQANKLAENALIYVHNENIEKNFFYGFLQLNEVAIKALSPGINDPGTAIKCIRRLWELFDISLQHPPDNMITDNNGKPFIRLSFYAWEDMFRICILPIWDYGKKDRAIQQELQSFTRYFLAIRESKVLRELQSAIENKDAGNTGY